MLNVPGCTATDGCDASGNYTFTDWKDVLAMVYGGQNHKTDAAAPKLIARRCAIPDAHQLQQHRAPRAGRQLGQPVLATGTGAPAPAAPATCTKLRHAFRRDDISGTTDTFVSLVGLVADPALHDRVRRHADFLPKPDAPATANPFCNAGERADEQG